MSKRARAARQSIKVALPQPDAPVMDPTEPYDTRIARQAITEAKLHGDVLNEEMMKQMATQLVNSFTRGAGMRPDPNMTRALVEKVWDDLELV